MSDLFGQVLGKILGKASGGQTASPAGGQVPDLGGLLGGVLGKDGSNLNAVVKRMLAAGLGKVVKSWISKGPNQLISPDEITTGLGADKIDELSKQLGLPKDQVASMLAQHLPDAVDQMTPEGELADGEVVDLTPKR
jgi:uncharacterized protein YidB (DUF937 family)